jgi:RND superfamily putative drug exporter
VSGITVIAAMAGMYFGGAATFLSFATGTILVVAIAVVGSLTVLPAVLSKLGDRVNKGRVPFMRPERRTGEARAWGWVLDRVLKRPLVSMLVAGSVLLALAIPVLHIHTADSGVDGLPRSLEIMKTYDRMQAAFPGETFSADIVVQGKSLDEAQIRDAVQEMRQVARESDEFQEPVTVDVSRDGELAVVEVPLAGTGTDERSMDAVRTLREDVVPDVFGAVSSGKVVGVTGFTAGSVDFNDLMASRIWLVFAFVFSVAFLLLLVTFRSIVIPVKAILLNLLSVAAALGIVTWVFQDGNLESLLGFRSTGAITAWFPLMLFVILFGLSMDYHVFILSRIREAGVVTAAAIVMVAVFGIFATLSFIDMKQFGVGLAAAVLIDATLVRGVLLPAAMKLLGDWNWYLPSWLEWLPRGRALEGESPAPEPEPEELPQAA